MYRTLPHSQPIGLVQSAYVTSLLRGDSTKLVQHQHIVLYERQNAAASLGMHIYGHALRCPQTELTAHKLHSALLTHLADVDLPCVPDFCENSLGRVYN